MTLAGRTMLLHLGGLMGAGLLASCAPQLPACNAGTSLVQLRQAIADRNVVAISISSITTSWRTENTAVCAARLRTATGEGRITYSLDRAPGGARLRITTATGAAVAPLAPTDPAAEAADKAAP
jgi:hypothetical protein